LNVGDAPDASESPFAALVYASLQIDKLEADHRRNRAEILRLGKIFGVVTRETSLIVLDRAADYARFEIAPPAELRGEYDRLVAALQQGKANERVSQLERVVKLFADRQAWWAREFPKSERPAPPKPAAKAAAEARPLAQSARDRENSARRESAVPAPRPAPAAAARATPPAPVSVAAADAAPAIGIQLRRWTPDAPYIARFSQASGEDVYRVYLAERAAYAGSTAFILDAAEQLLEKGQRELGLRVLSNLAEMDLENRHVLRVLGQRLVEAGAPKLAIPVFQQVLELSPEEPQSYRDLGLAYAADKQYQKAIDALYEVVTAKWHERFPEIELIALTELNAIAADAERAGTPLDLSRVDARLRRNLPLDTRVILTWDADSTDIDLWVTDPNGERAYYGNRLTYQGGLMSRDFTGGYGPEEFSLKHAKPGRYVVQVQFYGHNRTTVASATTLQVKLYSRFGTAEQRERMITLRLRERKESLVVGEFDVAPP
jgi:tetratricopeptide (TPR) repeat protein